MIREDARPVMPVGAIWHISRLMIAKEPAFLRCAEQILGFKRKHLTGPKTDFKVDPVSWPDKDNPRTIAKYHLRPSFPTLRQTFSPLRIPAEAAHIPKCDYLYSIEDCIASKRSLRNEGGCLVASHNANSTIHPS